MQFATDSLSVLDTYRLLTGGVIPRPIAWVSTRSSTGVDNLAPFSFFTIASVQPPVLAIVQLRPPHRPAKDTLVNLRATRECVVNIATSDLLDAMNATAADYPPDISEFDMAQIERCASQWVGVPGVKQACVRHECRLRDVLELGNNPMGGTLILLDVVGSSVNESLLQDGALVPARLDTLGKLGADWYCSTREQCERQRPAVSPVGNSNSKL